MLQKIAIAVREICEHKNPRRWKTRLCLVYLFAAAFALVLRISVPAVSAPAPEISSQCSSVIDRTVIVEPVYERDFTIANMLHVSVRFRLF